MTGGLPALRYPPAPAQIAPYVTALGPELAVTFLLTFGGAELYIARDPKGRSQVEALVGPDLTRTLQAALGTYPRRIPLGKKWLAQCMSARGDSLATIARTLRTTDVSVRRWLK